MRHSYAVKRLHLQLWKTFITLSTKTAKLNETKFDTEKLKRCVLYLKYFANILSVNFGLVDIATPEFSVLCFVTARHLLL